MRSRTAESDDDAAQEADVEFAAEEIAVDFRSDHQGSQAGFAVWPERWMIECTLAWVRINVAGDPERFAGTAKALFQIAMIKLRSQRIGRYRDFESDSKRVRD